MQIGITIAQAEIEEAIKARVLEQISVKDGQEINIELRATRGPEGFTAVITIDNSGDARPAPVPTRQRVTTADLKRMQEEEARQEAEQGGDTQGEEQGSQNDGSDGSNDEGPQPNSNVLAEAQAPQPVVTQPAPVASASTGAAPAKKRLFGNVVKPNNA